MHRNLELSRDEAELLDDLLLADGSERARRIAADLWTIWGMSPWENRPPANEKTPGRNPG
jgi:hypothetical protein